MGQVLSDPQGEKALVQVLHNVNISCKGQVTTPEGKDLTSPWPGCRFGSGTCVWNSRANTASKKPYCVAAGGSPVCVPHAPGPNEGSVPESETLVWGGPLSTVVVLTQPMWGHYYHFLIDSMTRIVWVRQQYPSVLEDPRTVFHTGLINEVGQAWARLMGIETSPGQENKLLDGQWTATTAYFPPGNGCMNRQVGTQPNAVQGASALVRASLARVIPPQQEGGAPVALLVVRDPRKAKPRAVLNNDAVLESLRQDLPGWSIEVFSDWPKSPDVLSTCQMFYGARIVVAPHGAGIANMVCSRRGTVLVEIQQKSHSWDFEILSAKLGMPYFGVRSSIPHDSAGKVDMPALHVATLRAKAAAEAIAPLDPSLSVPQFIVVPAGYEVPPPSGKTKGGVVNSGSEPMVIALPRARVPEQAPAPGQAGPPASPPWGPAAVLGPKPPETAAELPAPAGAPPAADGGGPAGEAPAPGASDATAPRPPEPAAEAPAAAGTPPAALGDGPAGVRPPGAPAAEAPDANAEPPPPSGGPSVAPAAPGAAAGPPAAAAAGGVLVRVPALVLLAVGPAAATALACWLCRPEAPPAAPAAAAPPPRKVGAVAPEPEQASGSPSAGGAPAEESASDEENVGLLCGSRGEA